MSGHTEGSQSTCIAKCDGICLLNGLRKSQWLGFPFFVSATLRANGVKLVLRGRGFFLSEDNGSVLFVVLKVIPFR